MALAVFLYQIRALYFKELLRLQAVVRLDTPPGNLHNMQVIQPIVTPNKTLTFPLNALNIAVSSALYVVDETCQLTSATCAWGVASVSATFNIEKLTGTTAPGSGTALLTAVIDTSTTANTVNTGALTGTVSSLQFSIGDRVGVKIAGTITSLVGAVLTLTFRKL